MRIRKDRNVSSRICRIAVTGVIRHYIRLGWPSRVNSSIRAPNTRFFVSHEANSIHFLSEGGNPFHTPFDQELISVKPLSEGLLIGWGRFDYNYCILLNHPQESIMPLGIFNKHLNQICKRNRHSMSRPVGEMSGGDCLRESIPPNNRVLQPFLVKACHPYFECQSRGRRLPG